jgi:hypothetical protein
MKLRQGLDRILADQRALRGEHSKELLIAVDAVRIPGIGSRDLLPDGVRYSHREKAKKIHQDIDPMA